MIKLISYLKINFLFFIYNRNNYTKGENRYEYKAQNIFS